MSDTKPTFEERLYRGFDRIAGGESTNQPPPAGGSPVDWLKDSHDALKMQKVVRGRWLLYSIALIFLVLLVWSGFASIDEVTRGEGKVIPLSQLQVVQSFDGGVVEEIFVREGQAVNKGDLLVRIDPTRFIANVREVGVRAFALRVKGNRLAALIHFKTFVVPPHETAQISEVESQKIIAQEKAHYRAARAQLDEHQTIAKKQLAQRKYEYNEAVAALNQAEKAFQLADKELRVTKPLLKVNAVSDVDILRLERARSDANGERLRAKARKAQLNSAIQEAEARLREVLTSMRSEWNAQLSEVQAELSSLDENVSGLQDKVKYSEIRSPVNGIIQRVLYNTIGGVVQPGHAVVQVVPTGDKLLVEAKVLPKDIAFLRPNLPATIKFTAYDFTIYGGMQAVVKHISPDSITDDKGNTYYLVTAETASSSFKENLPVIPGMTVQLDILTGKRTLLAYILKPILRAKDNAFRER